MLDEPTAGVSPIVMDELFDKILEVAATGIAILMVEQNARQALNIADRGYVLVQGRNRFTDTGEALLADPDVRRTFPRRLRRWRTSSNAFVLLANFVLIPAITYGSQLALGALGVTLIYAVLRFSNFAHGDTMALRHHGRHPHHLVAAEPRRRPRAAADGAPRAAGRHPRLRGAAALVTDRWVYRFYRKRRSDPVIFVIARVGVMFIYNALTRFVIGTDDQRFEDGARFVIRANDFKAMDRPRARASRSAPRSS